MRLAWLTDIHLNFLTGDQFRRFCAEVRSSSPDGVAITGDIGEAPTIEHDLRSLEDLLGVPIWFVLGNHDFYRGRIADVRRAMDQFDSRGRVRWMTSAGVVPLTDRTALVGVDGWADGRLGSGSRSDKELNDFYVINEFIGLSRGERYALMALLGDEAAAQLRQSLLSALADFQNVVVLTHVPPFAAACRYNGQPTEDDYLPLYSCRALGELLLEAADEHSDRRITVLCGHTHEAATARIGPNLVVQVGGADYGRPIVQAILDIE